MGTKKSLLLTSFHLFGVLQFAASVYLAPPSRKPDFAGNFKYLTYQNLLVQLSFFSLALLIDLLKGCLGAKVADIRRLKDHFFAAVAFPFTMLVWFTFWAIYLFDRELIHPAEMDQHIPSWLNHLLHTAILVSGMEFALTTHHYPSRKSGFLTSAVFGIVYFLWIWYVKSVVGHWPYPFMDLMEVKVFILFLLVIALLLYCFYILGEKLNTIPPPSARKGRMGKKLK